MDKQTIQTHESQYRHELLHSVIPFWLTNAPDSENGAYFNYLDRTGQVYCTDKPVWVIGRLGWLTSLLYNEIENRAEWLQAARSCVEFLEAHCFDCDGRMFFEVTADGRPLRKRRYLFTETFAVMALSEFSRAAGDQERQARAVALFKLIHEYNQHPERLEPKYIPETLQAKSHAMAMILVATGQQLRKICSEPLCDQVIQQSQQEIFNHFMHPAEKALLETVGVNGERLDGPGGRCVNPGHAIETSWFIMEEYLHQQRQDDDALHKALQILDWSLELGWDQEYGGILYFVDVEGKPCVQYEHDMKLWWPHTEAIYATLLAYYLTQKEQYLTWYHRIRDWAYSHFPDTEHGEWFKYLHRDGTISTTLKGNGWAGPFHLPRMLFKCSQLLARMADE